MDKFTRNPPASAVGRFKLVVRAYLRQPLKENSKMMTKPFLTIGLDRMMTKEESARAIRQDIIAEHDAVSLYEAHIQATDDEAIKNVLQHIVDEEKSHVAELMTLLSHLDNDQKMFNVKGEKDATALIDGEDLED